MKSVQRYLDSLVAELRKLPAETSWVEFKENNANLEDIGEYISALGNMAVLSNKAAGYLIWGIRDTTHEVVGTTFNPLTAKKGNEDILNWLTRLLTPHVHLEFQELIHEGKRLILLEVPRAPGRPIQFQGIEYIRVGSYRKKLKEHPQIEAKLWQIFDTTPFEETVALTHIDDTTTLSLLDYPSYFEPSGSLQSLLSACMPKICGTKPYDKLNAS